MSSINVNAISNEAGTGAPNFPNGLSVNSNPLPTAGSLSNRNKIINGAMVIDQRNAGASVTPTTNGQYVLDRWMPALSVASKYSVQRTTASAPVGFSHATLITSLSAYSPAAADFLYYAHKIEGYNVADLNWGTGNASTITVSFWVRSSLTGSFSLRLVNSSFNRSYVTTYTINSADTWEKKTITVLGDTSGTWEKSSNTGIELAFDLGSGSNYTTSSTNSWQAGSFTKATGSISVLGTNGATFYLTGVQLEVGDTATPFEHRSYGQELALCQRYYIQYDENDRFRAAATATGTSSMEGLVSLPVQMRATPTVTTSTDIYNIVRGITNADRAISGTSGTTSKLISVTCASGSATSGTDTGIIYTNTGQFVKCSAEL